MATFTYSPSYGAKLNQTPKILEATFGDGYELSVEQGINYNPKVWNLTFANRTDTDADAIISFFTTNKTFTTTFDWTDLDGTAGKYKCKKWDRGYDNYGTYTVTAVFEEKFW